MGVISLRGDQELNNKQLQNLGRARESAFLSGIVTIAERNQGLIYPMRLL